MMKVKLKSLWIAVVLLSLMYPAFAQQSLSSSRTQKMDHFVDSLLKKMTLQEKIGQLNLITGDMAVTGPTISKDYLTSIKAGKVGGIFNAFTPELVEKIQHAAVDSTRLHIPLLFGFDVIHGHKTIFPIPLAMACSWDTAAIKKLARTAADEATADGLNWVFSPMVDIARDPRWGRVMEGAGEDPWLGSQIAKAYIRGYQGTDLSADTTVMASVKHFALYGAVEGGRDYNTVDMSKHRMFQYYFPPYKAAVEAGVASLMTSFNVIDGVPATVDQWLLQDVLRKKWGYDGLIESDYGSIGELLPHGVADNMADASKMALQAGTDMDMMSFGYIRHLKKLVDNGGVSIKDINRSVKKVLEAKYKLGLFENPYKYISKERAAKEIMSVDKLAFERDMARKSIVLLKNEKQLLPLSKEGTIAVIGPLAKDKKDMLGAWSGAGDWHKATSIFEGIQNAVGTKVKLLYAKGANITDDTSLIRQLHLSVSKRSPNDLIKEAVKTAKKSEVVILSVGESQGMSGEAASRSDIRIPESQRTLIKAIYATGTPIVLVLSNGRSLVLKWAHDHIPSILETWFLGTKAGDAIADVLFGKYNPSGKLTMSFPYSVGQIPVYYNHLSTGRPRDPAQKYTSKYLDIPNAPLYPFGYGLSYTHFTYSNLQLDKKILYPGQKLKVSVTITNDGDAAGEETAQLYIRDMVASIAQPVKELKGMKKVFLEKGASKTIHFELRLKDLKFYGKNGTWTYEPGKFKVFVGGNSKAVKTTTFVLKNFMNVGHRGTRGLMPENTIPAFEKGIEVGANTIEFDVHITKDDKVVIYHDNSMNPAYTTKPDGTDIPKDERKKYTFYQMDYADIRKFIIGEKDYPAFPEQKRMKSYAPLLTEMMDSVENFTQKMGYPPVTYLLEIKSNPKTDGFEQPAPETFMRILMNKLKPYLNALKGRLIIQSFDMRPLQVLHKTHPDIPLGLLTGSKSVPKNLKKLGFTPAYYNPYFTLVNPGFLKVCHQKDMKVLPWTVEKIGDMKKLMAMGVDGIISDYPNRVSQALKR